MPGLHSHLVMKRFAGDLPNAHLSRAESPEVLASFRTGVSKELHHDSTDVNPADTYIEETSWLFNTHRLAFFLNIFQTISFVRNSQPV